MNKKKFIILLSSFIVTIIVLIILLVVKVQHDNKNKVIYSEEYLHYQTIFNFELSEGKDYYQITMVKNAHRKDPVIKVPDTIDNIPVKKLIGDQQNFDSWKNIPVIEIGKNIEYIGTDLKDNGILNGGTYGDSIFTAFKSSTVAINVNPDNKVYKSIDGILFSKDLKTLIRYPNNKVSEAGKFNYVIPDYVEEVYDKAFYLNQTINSVYFGNKVLRIGDEAFTSCVNLHKVTFSENLLSIGAKAFKGCSLATVTLPNSLTALSSSVFSYNTNLTDCFIPSSVKTFGKNIFTSANNTFKITTDSTNVEFLKSQDNLKAWEIVSK